jgi:3-hydroxyacyl-[acyl-carrier-protein] dehydratase
MLRNDFYFITDENAAEGLFRAEIRFVAGHSIFEGHFPGQPVVPGVCMMQLVKESLEWHLQTRLNLVNAPGVKFVMVIDPRSTPVVSLQLKYKKNETGNLIADAQLHSADTIYFKMKGEFNSAKDLQES